MVDHERKALSSEQEKFRASLAIVDREDFRHLWHDVLPHTPPEVLAEDPVAQKQLRDVLVTFRNATKREKDPPLIELFQTGTNHARTPGLPVPVRERFRLQDGEHIYLLVDFDAEGVHGIGNRMAKVPYLKSPIPTEPVSLWRIPKIRGFAEEYHAADTTWKVNTKFEFLGLGIGSRRESVKK